MRHSLHRPIAPGNRLRACVCLLAVLLLWTPLWAAAWQTHNMSCCTDGMCPLHGHAHPAVPKPQAAEPASCRTRRRASRLRASRFDRICSDVLLDVLLPGQQLFSDRRHHFRAACTNDDFLRHSGRRCSTANLCRRLRAILRSAVPPSSNHPAFGLTPTY